MEGKVFIIPNATELWGGTYNQSGNESFCKRIKNSLGLESISEDTEMVQVWVTGGDSDNWVDHYIPGTEERFPSILPVGLFDGLKEGDTLELTVHGIPMSLTLAQKEFRYRQHGRFEEVLARCVRLGQGIRNKELTFSVDKWGFVDKEGNLV